MEEVKRIQVELLHRTEVEKQAEELICQCRFMEAMELLRTI